MVDVVEAMMTSGPTHFEAAASTSRLSSTTSGTPSNTMPASASAAAMSCAGTTETRAMTASASLLAQQSEPRQARQRLADFAERLGFEGRELFRGARLDVDHGDGVAGIGEGDRDAAAHAAGAETGNGGAGAVIGQNPRAAGFAAGRGRGRRDRGLPACGRACMKSSPQIAPPMARKDFASGVATPASSATETSNDRPSRRSSRM